MIDIQFSKAWMPTGDDTSAGSLSIYWSLSGCEEAFLLLKGRKHPCL
uniref:Uncharacterized protein n=1 Tax=Rhizophora mucronata TaxID=61149 RepID=A0A2P2QHF9_RHIMU